MNTVYLSLGTNLGDRKDNLQKAIAGLAAHPNITVARISSIYETEPVGFLDQSLFFNIVLMVKTSLSPKDLLEYSQNIEQELYRERTIRWGPRTIDIDILLYNDLSINTETLIIPHPRMLDRAFVLIPLAEIAPGLTLNGKNIAEFLTHVTNQGVKSVDVLNIN